MTTRVTATLALCMGLAACDQQNTQTSPATEQTQSEVTPAAETAATPTPSAKPKRASNTASEFPMPAFGLARELHETHAPRNNIELARNSTVFIDSGFGTGSGFFIDDKCTIVTNKHVVELSFENIKEMEVQRSQIKAVLERGIVDRESRTRMQDGLVAIDKALDGYRGAGQAKDIKISLVNGREIEARTLASSQDYDLAYLYVKEEGCPYFVSNEETNLPLGQRVFTIGNPAGMKYSVTAGIVSGYQNQEDIEFIQTDAAINPGNSGGPLIDSDGRLLGVNTMILSQTEGIGFALPANSLLADLKANRGKMNIELASRTLKAWKPQAFDEEDDLEREEKERMVDESLTRCIEEYDDQEWGAALKECRLAADYGDPRAQYFMAEMTFSVDDQKSREQALVWYDESHRAGYAESLYRMGQFHESGDYLSLQPAISMELYEEACNKDYASACNETALGHLNANDHDAVPDFLLKAIRLGSVVARVNLAYLYDSGKGVRKDPKRAHELYEEAASLGSNLAQLKLAVSYYEGEVVKKDYHKAYEWALISEMDPPDDVTGWDDRSPEDVRFALQRMLNRDQQSEAVDSAQTKLVEINEKAETYRRDHLYRRKVG